MLSFEQFAFFGPRSDAEAETPPLPPWQHEASITPILTQDGSTSRDFRVAISRSINGLEEIWLNDGELPTNLRVYEPASRTWRQVSSALGDTGLYVESLYVTKDGAVWGGVSSSWIEQPPSVKKHPVLSKYNDTTGRFEWLQNILEIPVIQQRVVKIRTNIILDDQDTFWIFVENDGLYHFDPAHQTTQRLADIPDAQIYDAAIFPTGDIYFDTYHHILSEEDYYAGTEHKLFQFMLKTNEIIAVDLPEDSQIPFRFSGLQVDSLGRLWLGMVGYREQNGSWNIVHQPPAEYIPLMQAPTLFFQSSDGRLWYRLWSDGVYWADGTAWYNPKTGEGCMFTNLTGSIVEDSQHQLWMAVRGELYRYRLDGSG